MEPSESLQSIAESLAESLKAHVNLEPDPSGHSRHTINNKNYRRVLIHHAPFLFTCDSGDHLSILRNHSVVVEDDAIVDVLPADKVNPNGSFDLVYDTGSTASPPPWRTARASQP